MFPDSPFAGPIGSFEKPVHAPLANPAEGPFVYVKINEQWLPYVIGALKQLLLQATWIEQDTPTLDLTQMQAFKILQMFTYAGQNPTGFLPECPPPVAEMEYEMSICEQLRFQNGKLQGYCCGEWVDITGQDNNLGVGFPDQPGDGLPQPTPGGCQTYHGKMPANGPWNLPAGVNAGDIITVSNVMGATNGGLLDSWYCWEGDTYFLGTCIPATGDPQAGDPLPTVKHMRLVALIDGVYYDATSPINVPSGVANAPVVFQVNAATLSTNAGDLAFDVEVCNNQSAGWCYVVDFKLTTGGFVPDSAMSGVAGVWMAGVGWQQSIFSFDNVTYRNGVYLTTPTAVTIPVGTTISVGFDYALGLTDTPSDPAQRVVNTGINNAFSAALTGTNLSLSSTYSGAGIPEINFECDRQNFSTAGFHGTLTLTSLKFSNPTGDSPFGSSNC